MTVGVTVGMTRVGGKGVLGAIGVLIGVLIGGIVGAIVGGIVGVLRAEAGCWSEGGDFRDSASNTE